MFEGIFIRWTVAFLSILRLKSLKVDDVYLKEFPSLNNLYSDWKSILYTAYGGYKIIQYHNASI
jgi:hypothetical protein